MNDLKIPWSAHCRSNSRCSPSRTAPVAVPLSLATVLRKLRLIDRKDLQNDNRSHGKRTSSEHSLRQK